MAGKFDESIARDIIRDNFDMGSDMDPTDFDQDADVESDDLGADAGEQDIDPGEGQDFEAGQYLNEGDNDQPLDQDQRPQPRRGKRDARRRVSQTDRAPQQTREYRLDQQGNTVDQQGNIVARRGAETRMFKKMIEAQQLAYGYQVRAEEMRANLLKAVAMGKELYQRLEAAQQQRTIGQELGLTAAQQLEAMQLYKQGLTDPEALLRKLLTQAATRGIDVTKLGLQPGGVDAKSLAEIISGQVSNLIQPIVARNREDAARQQAENEYRQRLGAATEQVEAYFRRNPDMLPHAPIFHRLLQEFPNMTLGEADARIRLQLTANRGNSQPNRRRRMPSGRRAFAQRGNGADTLADPKESWDNILRSVMDDLQVQ